MKTAKFFLIKLFNIFPEVKKKYYFILLNSLLISFLDLISFSLIGFIILFLFDSSSKTLLDTYIVNYIPFKIFILLFASFIVFLIFFKNIFSWLLLKKILKIIFEEQLNLRLNFLNRKLFFRNNSLRSEFKYNLAVITEFSKTLTESSLLSFFRFSTDTVIFVIILFFLFYKNFFLTFFFILIVISTFFLYIKIFKKKLIKYGKITKDSNQELLKVSEFIFSTIKDIQAFNKERVFISKIENISKKISVIGTKYLHLLFLPRYYVEFTLIFFLVLMSIILLTYSNSINDTFVTIGIFTAAAARMAPLMNTMLVTGSTLLNSLPMINSLNTSNNFRKYNYSKNSLHTSNYPKPINEISAIRIKNLCFKYRNGSKNQIFKELSVSFKKNSIVGIYGSSGLGKSTFINLITRFLEPTKGKIIFENKKKILSRPEEEKIISSVSQETVLLNENFYKNIALDYKINKSDKLKINKIFKIVQLHEVVKRLNRKSQKLGHRGSLLSGGQKQKIALGRAIFRDSKVLIFDEPFSGIDGISSIKLLKFLNTIKKDKIIIIITHQVFLKKFFDYVYNIKNKKLFLSKAVFS